MLKTVINKNELRVLGIRRTGNHAIISWIIDDFNGIVVHLNNLKRKHPNPYQSFGQVIVKGLPYYKCRPHLMGTLKNAIKKPKQILFSHTDPYLDINYIQKYPEKSCLIYSYENYKLDEPIFELLEEKHDEYLGKSNNRIDLIILRDPFNLFASLLKSGMMDRNNHRYITSLFKQYAQEFITNKTSNSKRIYINYNKWFMSSSYRIEIAQAIGFETTGEIYTVVPSQGGGSSFSGQKFDNNVDNMKVLERWKMYKDDPFYQQIFKDIEIRQLSREIFGPIALEMK